MNLTYDRESFVRSGTADLSRQIDDILDHRFSHTSLKEAHSDVDPMDPNPIALVRTLIKNFSRK